MSDGTEAPEPPAGLDWETYYAHRNRLDEIRVEQSSSFDKSILTLSSGALAFSLVVLKGFHDQNIKVALGFLVVSWTLFVFAILFNVLSYFVSSKAAEVAIERLDTCMRTQNWEVEVSKFWDKVTRKLNSMSGILFAMGAICLLIFAYQGE
ncbi:hypothetical protein [Mesorhizobium sangaii]|uniref:DUF1772 domain-containing protein n=1 Tax=Mesorhizobium sangaii TaxID=505389 RepID=A0A841PVT7_9HYPH|nr:hypothetical protein [Mesorhizobium sangaii]MBB6414242.1 hypothetical protein [Mesorhizobium sangaii]